MYGHADLLQVLVKAKAGIDKATTVIGTTPAFMAAQNGHADSLRVLVKAKADIDKAKKYTGITPAYNENPARHTAARASMSTSATQAVANGAFSFWLCGCFVCFVRWGCAAPQTLRGAC